MKILYTVCSQSITGNEWDKFANFASSSSAFLQNNSQIWIMPNSPKLLTSVLVQLHLRSRRKYEGSGQIKEHTNDPLRLWSTSTAPLSYLVTKSKRNCALLSRNFVQGIIFTGHHKRIVNYYKRNLKQTYCTLTWCKVIYSFHGFFLHNTPILTRQQINNNY